MSATTCGFSLYNMMPPCVLPAKHDGDHTDGFGDYYGREASWTYDDELEGAADESAQLGYKARRIEEAISHNVDEFCLDLVTFERFSARQVRLWKRAELADVFERVTVLVRPKIGGGSR